VVGGAPRDHHAPAGRLGWPEECPWRPSHGSRRRRRSAPGGGGAPAMVGAGNGALRNQEDTAQALRCLAWAGEAWSSKHCGWCELKSAAMADAAAFPQ